MAMQSNDSTVRTQLHTDINLAWATPALKAIYDDEDVYSLPKTNGTLPFAVVNFDGITSEPGGGLKFVQQRYPYTIIGVFPRPSSGTVKAAVHARINELLTRLTASVGYASAFLWTDVNTDLEQVFGKEEPVFTVTVTFEGVLHERRSS